MVHEVRVPNWAIGIIWSLLGVVFAGGLAWGVQRNDVSNLRKDVDNLKPLAQAIAAINTEIPNMKRSIESIEETQSDMQRDIKTLLSRGH